MNKQYNLIVSNDWVSVPYSLLIQIAQMRLRVGDVVIYCSPDNQNDTARRIAEPFMGDGRKGMALMGSLTVTREPKFVLQLVQGRREENPSAKIHLCIDAPQDTSFDKVKRCFQSKQGINPEMFDLDSLNEAALLVDGLSVFVRV